MDAVSDMAKVDDCYLSVLLESILCLLMDEQSNIFLCLHLVVFEGVLYRR